MKKNLRLLAGVAAGALIAIAFSSCAYDPYYSSGSVGTTYGDGYGYGSSSFSTSLFVSTGDPRWGYDPNCYSYYDYQRRCYYDPYLNGYYPVGYRPPVVYGAPHPYGWRPGRGYCPPPRNYRNVYVSNYRNRESAYRNSNYSWAKQVRQQSSGNNRPQGGRPSPGRNDNNNFGSNRPSPGRNDNNFGGNRPSQGDRGRPNEGSRPQGSPFASRPQGSPFSRPQDNSQSRPNYGSRPVNGSETRGNPRQSGSAQRPQPQNPAAGRERQGGGGIPSRYNTPVTSSPQPQQSRPSRDSGRQQARESRPEAAPSEGRGQGGGDRQEGRSRRDRDR